jgi:hypothetical protein
MVSWRPLQYFSCFWAHQRLLQSKKGRSNAQGLFQVEEIPSDPQIRNLVDPLSSQYFQEDSWFLPGELKEQKGLWQFQNELNTHSIALEGVSFFSMVVKNEIVQEWPQKAG